MSHEIIGRDILWEAILQKEDYPIFRLAYLSKPVKPFTDGDLNEIESKSLGSNNARVM
jgi:hypothetical protein